jgi:hypothetical protein
MSEPSITAEWIEKKRHYLFWRDGRRWAYVRVHGGDARRWDVLDARYVKIVEIAAETFEEAADQVTAMIVDGSLERLMERRTDVRSRVPPDFVQTIENYQPDQEPSGYYEAANLDELRTKLATLLDEYAETPGARQLVNALRRAAGFDRDTEEGQHSLVLPFPRHAD